MGRMTASEFKSQSRKINLDVTSHAGQLSLAIPPWVSTPSIGDGLLAIAREQTASSA